MIPSNTYCVFPWSHLHVGVYGTAQMCCISSPIGNIKNNNLKEIWNNDTMKRVRLQMLNNEKPKECDKCWRREDVLKGTSLRMGANSEFAEFVDPVAVTASDGSVDEMKLLYVDYRFNNLCNFKCRICSPMYSSSLGSEFVSFSKIKMNVVKDQGDILYEEIKKQYPHVRKIYFAGGEPVMQHEHFQVLNDLVDLDRAKDVELIYSTNGSKFKSGMGNMFDYWSKFKKVHLVFSIDGFRKQAEYWRSGTNWEEVESNIRSVKQYNNIRAQIHSVVGWPNVFNWIEFIKYAIDTDLIDKLPNSVDVTPIDSPACFSLKVAPEFKKVAIRNELNKLKEYITDYMSRTNYVDDTGWRQISNSIDVLLNSMDQVSHPISKIEFEHKNKRYDIWRNEDFFTVFPEHEDMRDILT